MSNQNCDIFIFCMRSEAFREQIVSRKNHQNNNFQEAFTNILIIMKIVLKMDNHCLLKQRRCEHNSR
jgi:hypothetical protein